MNNKRKSKSDKNTKPKSKKLKIKKKSGGVGDEKSPNTITRTKLLKGLQIYYTDDYKFIIDYIKNKTDTILDPPPEKKNIDEIKKLIDANSSNSLNHYFRDRRLILMIQNTETNETKLQEFYDKLCKILRDVKHKIYIFLPFFCNTVLYPANVHFINKKKLVNLANTNKKLFFFDIDKIFSILENRPGALVFGRSDASYSSNCKDLTRLGENMLKKVSNAIITDNVDNIKTKPKDYDNIPIINMSGTHYLGNQFQMPIDNQQQTSIPSNLKPRNLNKYGVDKVRDWSSFDQSQLRELKINGPSNENVLILGDSWSAGYYLNNYSTETDSDFLARPVLLYSNKNIYYPDRGAFGYTSRDLINFLQNCYSSSTVSDNTKILKKYLTKHVGIVVLFIGINDPGNYISSEETDKNKKDIKNLLRRFNEDIKILVVEYPKNLFELSNQYRSMAPGSMVNSVPVSGYDKYGKEIADGIQALEKQIEKEKTIKLSILQPGDLSINDNVKFHLSTGNEYISMQRRVGGKNNKKQKYKKYKTKEVLGKKRQIFRKNDSKSQKEYIKYKNECILVKEYIKIKKSARK